MNEYQTLIDSDAFIGWLLERDGHHSEAVATFSQMKRHDILCTTTSLVIIETATVLSRASGQALAKRFLDEVIEQAHFAVIYLDEKLFGQSLALFKAQTRRGTSVADCANVAVMQQFAIPTIFSFDQVYTKDFGLAPVESLLE